MTTVNACWFIRGTTERTCARCTNRAAARRQRPRPRRRPRETNRAESGSRGPRVRATRPRPMALPRKDARNSATSVSCHPRNAPIIAIIFTSPNPSASLPSARLTGSPIAEQDQAAGHGTDERLAKAGRQHQAERQPDHDARQRDDVRQDAMPEINREEHDHRGGEQRGGRQAAASARTARPRRRRSAPVDELQRSELRRDRGAASRATAAQREPADDRDVLPRPDLPFAVRAMRSSPEHRSAARQPVDADVEK